MEGDDDAGGRQPLGRPQVLVAPLLAAGAARVGDVAVGGQLVARLVTNK